MRSIHSAPGSVRLRDTATGILVVAAYTVVPLVASAVALRRREA